MSGEQINDGETKVPFEEALSQAGFGVYSLSLTALTGLCIISAACVVYGGTIIVPASACELDTSTAQQGLIVAMPIVGAITGAVLWGYLADTRGRRKMLLWSLLLGAIANAVASISVHWAMLMVLQFLAAFLASGQYSLPMTLLSESVPTSRRNLVVLMVTSIYLLAQGTMAVLALPIIPLAFSYYLPALDIYWNSWRTVMLVYSLPSLVALLWLLFMQESPKFVFVKGDDEKALEILQIIHRRNNRRSKEDFQVKELLKDSSKTSEDKPSVKDQIVPLFRMPLLKYTIIMTSLFVLLQAGTFMVWLPRIANQFVELLRTGEGSNLSLCGIIAASIDAPPDPNAVPCALDVTALLIVLGVGTVQSIVNGLLSLVVDRGGRRNTAVVIIAVCGASGLVLNWVPNAIGSAVLFVIFVTGMLVMGLYTAISVALFPTHLRALAISLTMTGSRITNIAMIQILNYLLVNNCEVGFYVFASMFASSAIIALLLPNDKRQEKPAASVEETKEVSS